MAEKKTKTNMTLFWVAIGVVLIFGGIIYFAWSTKPADTSTETTTTTGTEANVDKLGAREVKLTPENFTEVTTKNKLVLVDMYSPTCVHCQKIAPILSELADEYGDKLVVAKMSIGIDANREFMINWDKSITGVPAVTIFKDGQKVEGFSGERTKAEFQTLIDKYLN